MPLAVFARIIPRQCMQEIMLRTHREHVLWAKSTVDRCKMQIKKPGMKYTEMSVSFDTISRTLARQRMLANICSGEDAP